MSFERGSFTFSSCYVYRRCYVQNMHCVIFYVRVHVCITCTMYGMSFRCREGLGGSGPVKGSPSHLSRSVSSGLSDSTDSLTQVYTLGTCTCSNTLHTPCVLAETHPGHWATSINFLHLGLCDILWLFAAKGVVVHWFSSCTLYVPGVQCMC